MVAGVWTRVGFSNLQNFRTRIQKVWCRSGVGVWKSDSSHLCSPTRMCPTRLRKKFAQQLYVTAWWNLCFSHRKVVNFCKFSMACFAHWTFSKGF